jgi:hypothetical protein
MRKFSFLFLCFFPLLALHGEVQDYFEPQQVATTEGLPSSLVNQSVCAISGEYTDSVVDLVIPGPEPLVISRVYTSATIEPWSFNHTEHFLLKEVRHGGESKHLITFRQPSGALLD